MDQPLPAHHYAILVDDQVCWVDIQRGTQWMLDNMGVGVTLKRDTVTLSHNINTIFMSKVVFGGDVNSYLFETSLITNGEVEVRRRYRSAEEARRGHDEFLEEFLDGLARAASAPGL